MPRLEYLPEFAWFIDFQFSSELFRCGSLISPVRRRPESIFTFEKPGSSLDPRGSAHISSLEVKDTMHLMKKKKARDKVSSAPERATAAPADTTSKANASSPTATAKESTSLIVALFASKVKSPPPLSQPRSPILSSAESSPEKKFSRHTTIPDSSAEASPAKSLSLENTFARGLRKELSKRLAQSVVAEEDRHDGFLTSDDNGEFLDGDAQTKELQSAKQFERQLQALTVSSAESLITLRFLILASQSEEAWRRENAWLREQLAVASKREVAQTQQLKAYETQLANCKQELEQLRNIDGAAVTPLPPPAHNAMNEALLPSVRERELLRLVIELVGKDTMRALLRENSHATSADIRHALVKLRLDQQQRYRQAAPPSPPYRSPSERSSSPSRDHPSTTTTKMKGRARDAATADGSSPVLDAIYAK